jgi:hypothetical protein
MEYKQHMHGKMDHMILLHYFTFTFSGHTRVGAKMDDTCSVHKNNKGERFLRFCS